ncbi:MAG: hypothetical protein LVS60_03340 [Nodosilinea sp. LVE1205-7]|jgi:hypothetical protein
MVTAFNILYSAAAVRRLLGLNASSSVQLKKFAWVIWVWVKGRRPTFISKRVFLQHFVEWRKAQSRGLRVTALLSPARHYSVRNPSRNTAYLVEQRSDGVFCTCDDFNNQLEFFSQGCCKHGYAVLRQLGWSSLQAYLQAQKVRPLPRAYEVVAIYAA